jgi:hypothetical protein
LGGERSPGRRVAADVGRPNNGRVRVCALVAVIACGVLAVPATARSDPFSTGNALQQADAAMADAQTLASQELTASSSLVSKAVAIKPESVPTSAADLEKQTAQTVSDVIASVGVAPTSAAATPQGQSPSSQGQSTASPRSAHRNRHRSAPRVHRSAALVNPARWGGLAADGSSSLRATGATPSAAAPSGRGSATPDRSARPEPHHLPPPPVPPQNPSGTAAGGSGTTAPLTVAALAAVLLVLFEFLSRLLPRSAFRKPRRLVLPPWHPG